MAFEGFRTAIIPDGSSPHMTVAGPEGIEDRLEKLLMRIQERPLRGSGSVFRKLKSAG